MTDSASVSPTSDAVGTPEGERAGAARFRLRWDENDLVLEELGEEQEYVERFRPGIGVSPSPLVATHPDLKALLVQSLNEIKHGFLSRDASLDVVLSPPWAVAWLLNVGELRGDDLEEHVEWELSQRVEGELSNYIYAWQQLNDHVYAILVRPKLIAFWDDLARELDIRLGSITFNSGLVVPELERKADLLSIYRAWRKRSGAMLNEHQPAETARLPRETAEKPETAHDFAASPDTIPAPKETDEPAVELESPRLPLEDEPEPDEETPFKPARKRRFWLVFPLIVILGAAGWFLLHDRLLPPEMPVETTETVEVVEEAPPIITSSAFILDIFRAADSLSLNLPDVMLQGDVIRTIAVGPGARITSWANLISGSAVSGSVSVDDRAPDTSGPLVTIHIMPGNEQMMTAAQFAQIVTEMGYQPGWNGLVTMNGQEMKRLLTRLDDSRFRPFRLSIHQKGNDRYSILAMP